MTLGQYSGAWGKDDMNFHVSLLALLVITMSIRTQRKV